MSSLAATGTKPTWVTRRVPSDLTVAWVALRDPQVGDLLLCEVVRIGLHGRVETVSGGRSKLYAGDRIICALAHRYATSLLEAVAQVGVDGVDMISASGLCGRVIGRAHKATKPTMLRPLAQAMIDGRPLNLRSYTFGAPPAVTGEPNWVVVVGSAMDSGKTTACASLIHGLVAAGCRVGAAKVTGTASARDFNSFRDAGATPVLDFLDAGWPSTAACTMGELVDILDGVVGHLRGAGIDWAIIEIADGVLQTETSLLLECMGDHLGSATFILTAQESLAAVAGVERLTREGHVVGAVSGLITNNPLSCREVELACAVPCVPTSQLGRRLARGSLAAALPLTELDDEALGAATA